MSTEQQIREESMLDLIAHMSDDVALIEGTEALSPMAAAVLQRLRARIHQLDVLATAIEVQACQ